jgi:hypothetical protein
MRQVRNPFCAGHGCLTLGEVCIMSRKPPSMDTWSDADFCLKCSKDILVLIGPALNGIAKPLKKSSGDVEKS